MVNTTLWREHLGKSRNFELFAVMAPPFIFAVLAGWTTDAGAGLFLLCLAIYSDALIALLWFVEKDDAKNEPPLSHPRSGWTVRCVKGLQPVDAREAHALRSAQHRALRGDRGQILGYRRPIVSA
jgi:hypothetical protein